MSAKYGIPFLEKSLLKLKKKTSAKYGLKFGGKNVC